MSQIDKPAAQNTWHDVPEISVSNAKDSIKSVLKSNATVKGSSQASSSTSQANHSDGSRSLGPTNTAEVQKRHLSPQPAIGSQAASRDSSPGIRDKISGPVSEGSDANKSQVSDGRERVKNYLSNKISQERLEQTKVRLRKLVLECQEHHDCEFRFGNFCKTSD